MTEDNKLKDEELKPQAETAESTTDAESTGAPQDDAATADAEAGEPAEKSDKEKLAEAEEMIAKLKDQLLRQMAEFDNFRKRTIKEKTDLILNGGQKVLESLLPVLDDLERAQENMAKTDDLATVKEGVDLIHSKLVKTLGGHGLKKMEVAGQAFDTDFHEAIALIPAQEEAQKNHIVDCVQPGYLLNEKVLRHAKVVVGQ